MLVDIKLGNCLDQMRIVDAASIDSIVTDPPYGLSFMGKGWDHGVPGVEFWTEALRVAKPGAHLLAFGGTRTYHRLACAIEDAGWEIRDCVMWVYGSGFPKSHDVSKAIDKAAGAEREVVGERKQRANGAGSQVAMNASAGVVELITAPATPDAARWQGWGTALKPAWEPIIVARKPLIGTVAENVLAHGTGAINVDGCRVAPKGDDDYSHLPSVVKAHNGFDGSAFKHTERTMTPPNGLGRWPANLIHDGSEEVVGLFPETTGKVGMTQHGSGTNTKYGKFARTDQSFVNDGVIDFGSAARFFYCAKASKSDRDEGCEALGIKAVHRYGAGIGEGIDPNAPAHNRNHHPTVKPTALMRYLCRLVTPPGGTVLDPFMGSGSTGKAAMLEGFQFIGIEREAEYVEIAKARIASAIKEKQSLGSGDQCVSRLPIGNSDSSGSVSPFRITCDAGPECGTSSNLHDNKRNKAICTTSYVQLLLFEEAE